MNSDFFNGMLDTQKNINSINSAKTLTNIAKQHEEMGKALDFEQKRKEEKVDAQIRLLTQSNENLEENNEHLRKLLELKEKELEESKISLIKSNKYNKKMFVMTLISTITAVIAVIVSILIAVFL